MRMEIIRGCEDVVIDVAASTVRKGSGKRLVVTGNESTENASMMFC